MIEPFPSDTDPDSDALRLMARDLAAAVVVAGPPHIHRLELTGQVVELRFVGDRASGWTDRLTRALAHLTTDRTDEPSFTITAWDESTTEAKLSPVLRAIAESTGLGGLSPRHEVPALTTGDVRTTALPWDGLLSMYSAPTNEAFIWIRDTDSLPIWDFGAPFRTVFNWWLSDSGGYCIHAGAVGRPEGALLLTGKGGSGKSTSCLSCVDTDLGYSADDYCVLTMADGPEVHSLYNTAKLNGAADLDRQPRFRSWIVNPEQLGEEKQLLFIHDHAPDALLRRAPLQAIVLPQVAPGPRPRLERIGGGDALRELAPTSLFQLPGTAAAAMGTMASLVRAVPSYRMFTGEAVDRIPPTLDALLRSLVDGQIPDTFELAE